MEVGSRVCSCSLRNYWKGGRKKGKERGKGRQPMSLAEFRWLDLSTWQPRSPGRRASSEGLSAPDWPVDRTVGIVLIKLTGLGRPSPLWQPHLGGPDCERAREYTLMSRSAFTSLFSTVAVLCPAASHPCHARFPTSMDGKLLLSQGFYCMTQSNLGRKGII